MTGLLLSLAAISLLYRFAASDMDMDMDMPAGELPCSLKDVWMEVLDA